MWFKYLEGGEIKSTAENLVEAANGENYEWTDMYDRMHVKLMRKDSLKSHVKCVELVLLRRDMKSVIASFFKTLTTK